MCQIKCKFRSERQSSGVWNEFNQTFEIHLNDKAVSVQ